MFFLGGVLVAVKVNAIMNDTNERAVTTIPMIIRIWLCSVVGSPIIFETSSNPTTMNRSESRIHIEKFLHI